MDGRYNHATITEVEILTRTVPLQECIDGKLVTALQPDNTVITVEEQYAEKISVWCVAELVCTWNGGDVSVTGNFTWSEAPLTSVPDEVPYEAPDQTEIDAAQLTTGTVDRISDLPSHQDSYPAWTQCGEDIGQNAFNVGRSSEPDHLEWALLFHYYRSDVDWWVTANPETREDRIAVNPTKCLLNVSSSHNGVEYPNFYSAMIRKTSSGTLREWAPTHLSNFADLDPADVYLPDKHGEPVADVLPAVKSVIYYCLHEHELRDKICYLKPQHQVEEYSYTDNAPDRSLLSLEAPPESEAPKYVEPTEQQLEGCGFDIGCKDALYVQAYNNFERAAERWDARQERFQQEIDRRIIFGETFWVCLPREDWLTRPSSTRGSRCYLIN